MDIKDQDRFGLRGSLFPKGGGVPKGPSAPLSNGTKITNAHWLALHDARNAISMMVASMAIRSIIGNDRRLLLNLDATAFQHLGGTTFKLDPAPVETMKCLVGTRTSTRGTESHVGA
jgi:hypothetical protein